MRGKFYREIIIQDINHIKSFNVYILQYRGGSSYKKLSVSILKEVSKTTQRLKLSITSLYLPIIKVFDTAIEVINVPVSLTN